MSAKVIQVIRVEAMRGLGQKPNDPVRGAIEYYTLDGVLLAEVDQWKIDEQKKRECLKVDMTEWPTGDNMPATYGVSEK
jgi:hypothetical protein